MCGKVLFDNVPGNPPSHNNVRKPEKYKYPHFLLCSVTANYNGIYYTICEVKLCLSVCLFVQWGPLPSCQGHTVRPRGLKFARRADDVTSTCCVEFGVSGLAGWHVARAGKRPISP